MMQRTGAVADMEFVGVRDRRGDVGLGLLDAVTTSRPLARPAAIADDNVQPVPCVFWVFIRFAPSRTTSPNS